MGCINKICHVKKRALEVLVGIFLNFGQGQACCFSLALCLYARLGWTGPSSCSVLNAQTWDYINLLNLLLEEKQISHFSQNVELLLSQKPTITQRIPPRLNKKIIFWPSTNHVERKPILTLLTTNSTFHSFYSLSWQLLPTRGNSLKSNCQEPTALVFRERERERDGESVRGKERERALWRKKCGGTTGSPVKLRGSSLLIPASH